MKCPKCKRTMDRKKLKDNYYYYECNYCKTIIGNKGDTEQKEDKDKE